VLVYIFDLLLKNKPSITVKRKQDKILNETSVNNNNNNNDFINEKEKKRSIQVNKNIRVQTKHKGEAKSSHNYSI
jgi:DNA-directed RNA polymerase subunit E'/Rpb7